MFPIIVDCKNELIKDYLANVSDLILESMINSIYPFRLLASEFNINNDVIFEYNHDLNDMSKISEEIVFSDKAGTVTEFLCVINNIEDGYVVTVDHKDKFSQDTIERFVNVFKEVLLQFLEKETLKDIDYTSNTDIELLGEYNHTETSFEYNDILDAFNDKLPKFENKILVGYGDKHYTYGESAFIANEIANTLNNLGFNDNDFISLFVPRSEWFLLASLGVLSAGCAYVPIDITYPDERIILMLEDSQSKVVLVSDETKQHIFDIIADNDLNIDVLNVSDIINNEIGSLNHLDSVAVDENDIGCVLYTSGTTGVPKGSLITRKAINNFVSWYVKETEFTFKDTYGMHCSYVFDIHTAALYAPIMTGGSLYIVPEDIRLDLKALNDFYVKYDCTHTYITSQVGKLFAESGMETTIKLLCFGGMKLGELNASDSIGPFETYGPSENLAVSTSIFANKRIHPSSIGRFISNVKGYVLDKQHRRVPIGAIGELYLSGHQLTPGYLNREEENNKSFFKNPFDHKKGYEQIYATGDMVRFLSDGTLSIVGRQDSQVKIRGNRVELTEVESVIRTIKDVRDVTVQIMDNDGNNELIAYIVLGKDFESDYLAEYVREYVSKRKPEYMVPSYVVQLDEIPLTVNGKINRMALPDVNVDSLRVEYVAPTTDVEMEIVEAFEKVFNQEKLGIYDDFVRLGGDSITAIKIKSLISKNIDATTIFRARTPYNIARSITENKKESGFVLFKKGTTNQNLFLLPPQLGASFYFLPLVKNLDFDGNIYLIDDFKFDLTANELKVIEDKDNKLINYYYDSIKDLFQDGDILCGYSLGCIYASLLAERLEKTKYIEKVILLDGTLEFYKKKYSVSRDQVLSRYDGSVERIKSNYLDGIEDYLDDKDKIIEITLLNSYWNYQTPKINSHIIFLYTNDIFKEDLEKISDNYEYIYIDTTHEMIVNQESYKINKYF